jgi:ferredoxin-NADP reductase
MYQPDQPTQGLPVVTPANMIPVQVLKREHVAPDAVTFHLVLPGTQQSPAPYFPGQFITLALPTPRETLYRSYSLCSDGDPQYSWEITVKKQHMGAVSTYFYTHVQEGMLLYSSLPRGTFTMPSRLSRNTSLIFVAAGSGITPIMGMLRAINNMRPDMRPLVHLHYASRSPRYMIFYRELKEMDPYSEWLKQWYYFSDNRERMTATDVLDYSERLVQRAHWYLCGPEILKRELIEELKAEGVPQNAIHTEVFAVKSAENPAYQIADGSAQGGSITIKQTGEVLEAEPRETLLAALERQGYHPSYSCRIGLCGSCKLKVAEGNAFPEGEILSKKEREQGIVLSCIAIPQGDIVLESGGKPPAGIPIKQRVSSGNSIGKPVVAVRVASLFMLGGMLLASWNLTNHRPHSWEFNTTAASSQNNSQNSGDDPSATEQTTPTNEPTNQNPAATATAKSGTQPTVTPTLKPGTTPTRTPTPKPGAATATPTKISTPTPKPTATSTPSPK